MSKKDMKKAQLSLKEKRKLKQDKMEESSVIKERKKRGK